MTVTNIEARRKLVSVNLSEQQQISILGCLADDKAADTGHLETLSRIIFALQGSYNEAGVQRWFDRPNPHLQNRKPIDIFSAGWKTEDRSIQAVLIVSQSLCGDPDRAASCTRCNPPKLTP